MSDQATRLRELVMTAEMPSVGAAGAPIVAVGGATCGVGATTVAAHLATVLVDRFDDVLLVDTHLNEPSASTAIMGDIANTTAERGSIVDVLSGRRTLAEVAQLGPAGIRMLPCDSTGDQPPHISAVARDRLLNELRRNAGGEQAVVIDTGPGLTPWTDHLWKVAQVVLVVTTPDPRDIANALVMLQLAARSQLLSAVRLVVNRCESSVSANHVHQQIGQVCYRQFNELLPVMPALPVDEQLGNSSNHHGEYFQAVRDLANALATEFGATPNSTPNAIVGSGRCAITN